MLGDVCMNDGICVENCKDEADYLCNCTSEYMGKNCTLMVSCLYAKLVLVILSCYANNVAS